MNGIQITAEARVGNDPELREVNGTAVCNLSLAVTERKQNKQTGAWEDAGTTWLRGAVWGAMANNVAVSLMKGMLVNVTGTLSERKFTTDQQVERTQLELRVDTISPSLRFATAQVIANDRGSGGGGAMPQQPQQQWAPGAPQQAPWQQQPVQQQAPVQQQQPVQQPQYAQQGQRPPINPQAQRATAPGQPGPQQNQQWQTPAYQHSDDVPF